MDFQQNQNRLLAILNYLWEYTDKEHYVTIVDIQKYLTIKGFTPDRKTITKDLDSLSGIGWINLECKKSSQNQYCITKRFIEESEVKVLCDAVRSSYFISEKNAKELVNTLKNFVGPTSKSLLSTPNFVDASVKTKNNDALKNAEKIAKAINDEKQISFKYFDYNVDKEKEYKHSGKRYIVSPYAMIINDGKYYFAAYDATNDIEIVKTFRVDKIDSVKVLDTKRLPKPKSFNTKNFESQFNMYGGHESIVELHCEKEVMYNIIDKFGLNVRTERIDGEHFKALVLAEVSPTFFGWVVGFGGKIKIVGPQTVLEEYEDLSKVVVI